MKRCACPTDLEFCQWNDVAVLWAVPDGRLTGGVVVVEARRVGVEQLPPLVVVRLLTEKYK